MAHTKKMPYKKTTGKVTKKSEPKMSYGKGKKKMSYKKKGMSYK